MPARHVVTLFRILLQSRSVSVNPALITHFSIALSSASDYDHKGTSHGDSAWFGTEELCNRLAQPVGETFGVVIPYRWNKTVQNSQAGGFMLCTHFGRQAESVCSVQARRFRCDPFAKASQGFESRGVYPGGSDSLAIALTRRGISLPAASTKYRWSLPSMIVTTRPRTWLLWGQPSEGFRLIAVDARI